MARARRAASPSQYPSMNVHSSPSKHILSVRLPEAIKSEMVTITANKGDKLKIIADAWHMEADCHYEWQIDFAPHDVDMLAIRAKFEQDGLLIISAERIVHQY